MKKFTKFCSALACACFIGSMAAQAEDFVWKFVTTGDATTLAIRSDGSLWGWGWNEKGQAATGGKERSAVPALANASLKWKKAVSGKAYTFALAEDGSLWAAGTGESGVQGTGDGVVSHKVLTRIGTDSDWTDVACGRFWSYVGFGIKADGTLWSWGQNTAGMLGVGSSESKTAPTQVGTDTDWKQVSAGAASVVALKTDGSLWGWGQNMHNELFGQTKNVLSPVRLGSDTDWEQVCVIDYRVYAVKKDGTLWAWGDNSSNLLGFNSATQEETTTEGNPVDVVTDGEVTEPRQVTAIEGKVITVSGCENTLSVGTGEDGVVDKVWMFGSNADGGLGDGGGKGSTEKDIPFATVPVHPSLRSSLKFTHVSGGQNYTMALTTDGDIWGWGRNRGGQLGDESRDDQLQVAYEVKPVLINCPQDEVGGDAVESVAAQGGVKVLFDGSVLSVVAGAAMTSAMVYDAEGNAVMVLDASASAWNVGALPAGVYVARFVCGGQVTAYKFLAK